MKSIARLTALSKGMVLWLKNPYFEQQLEATLTRDPYRITCNRKETGLDPSAERPKVLIYQFKRYGTSTELGIPETEIEKYFLAEKLNKLVFDVVMKVADFFICQNCAWKVATDFEAEDGTIADRLEPYDKEAQAIALEYAEKWDIGCGNRPIIYEKRELVVYVMEAAQFDESIPFAEQAKRFVIRGQMIPEYYVSHD